MSDKQEYSDDDESVIVDTEANKSSGFLQQAAAAAVSTVSSAVGSALTSFFGNRSQTSNGQMGERPLRKGQMEYKLFKTKNSKTEDSQLNKSNFRNVLSGIGRGQPVPSSNERGIVSRLPGTPSLSSQSSSAMPPKLSDPSIDIPHQDVAGGSKKVGQNKFSSNPRDTPPLFQSKFNRNIGQPPELAIESPDDSRDRKRARNCDVVDIEEDPPSPPVLEKEEVNDIVIPETPPKLVPEPEPEPIHLTATQLYLGNIECTYREISISSECLKLTSISPANATKGFGRPIRFNITFPKVDIRGFFHYSECRGPEEGHYLFFLVKKDSSEIIMGTLKKALRGSFLFDPDSKHESVKYLFMKCNRNVRMTEILKFLPGVPVVSFNKEVFKKRHYAIISNTYQRSEQIAQNSFGRPGQQTFRTHVSNIQNSNVRPQASKSYSTPPRPAPRTQTVKDPPLIELDDDDEDDEELYSSNQSHTTRSTRSSSTMAVKQEELIVNDDEMLFVYPPNDPAFQVQVYGRDLKCLKPGEYLNDNIIDFYLQYVMINFIEPEIRAKTHIFTTFFFTKLTEAKKDNPLVKDKTLKVYERVKKWLKYVDLFSKDYIVIPVNRSHHWFLIIVCNANNVQQVSGADDIIEMDELPRADKPCIIVMDSLGVVRTGGANKLTEPIRCCLNQEWLGKRGFEKVFDHSLIPDRTIKPPGQDNNSDCGLFLIKYVECFLKNPTKVLGAPTQKLGRDFLEIKDAKNLRKVIKKTIFDLWGRNRACDITVESTSHVDDNGDDEGSQSDQNLEIIGAKNGNGHPKSSRSNSGTPPSKSQSGSSDTEMEIVEQILPKSDDHSKESYFPTQESEVITSEVMTDDEDPITIRRHSTRNNHSKDENEDVSNKSMIVDVSTDDEHESTKMNESNDIDELNELIR